MKRLLLLFAACLLTLTTWAIPARRYTFTVQQPDGSVITLQLVGDEYFHYYRNVDTGEALTLASDGSYVPLSSAEKQTRQKVGQQRRVAANAQRAKRMAKRRADGPNRVGGIKPTNGTKKGLVILVNFSDVKMKLSNPQTAFYNQFNQEGYSVNGHIGSVRDYFKDQSYGNLTIDFDVVGPVTVSRNMDYYGSNDADGNDNNPATMIGEAVKLADAAGVDFSKYDWDGDGVVEQVYVIYAGYAESMGGDPTTIWPHEYTLSDSKYYGDGPGALSLDGVKVDTYACSSELQGSSGSKLAPIGTACHEFSHCLGFPDFYDTDYNGAFGMDAYDIMAGGSYNGPTGSGEVPSGYTAYERMAAGWLTPTELSGGMTIKGMKDLGSEAEAYVVYNPGKQDEYILFENRKADRWFKYLDGQTSGNGLLAIHVDYDETAWTDNTPNNVANHQRMHVIPANRKDAASANAFFPAGAQSLNSTSHSTCGGKWFNGTNKTFDHAITEIKVTNGLVDFLFDGGGVEDDGSRYTVTFDPGTGSCGMTSWTQSYFGESFSLPTAYVASTATGYSFIGWSETEATGSKPAIIYSANSSYMPTKNVTLYAVYKSTTAGGTSGEGGSYTLDYSKETSLQRQTLAYGTKVNYTATDGGTWVVKAYKNSGMQINAGKNASIKVPTCPSPITTIEVTDGTARVLSFSAQDYTGSNTPTALATSASSKSATIDLTGKNQTTGYIYTTDGATVITKIVVYYGSATGGSTTDYQTNPGTAPTLYTVTFDPCGGSCATASLKEASSGAGVTLPAATVSVAGWTFAGWATERISENMSTSPKVYAAGSNFKLTANATLYAVYVYTETAGGTGSGNYECVTEALNDWSGDYLIGGLDSEGYIYFADGRKGGSAANKGGIGDVDVFANLEDYYNEDEDFVTGTNGDTYHVTLTACEGGYLLQTQDGLYNYGVSGSNTIQTSDKASVAANYPVTITFNARKGTVSMTSATSVFSLNIDTQDHYYFRFYRKGSAVIGTNAIYLYKKQGSVLSSTYCSYPAGNAPTTVGALVKVISGLSSGRTTLCDLQIIIDRILQR